MCSNRGIDDGPCWGPPEEIDLFKVDGILVEIRSARAQQFSKHGYTYDHDDTHTTGEIALAAAALAMNSNRDAKILWPWSNDVMHIRNKGRRQSLIKAAALLVAEVERLDRRSDE